MTNRQTDRQTDEPWHSVYSNRPLSIAITAMRPNNNNNDNTDNKDKYYDKCQDEARSSRHC